MKSVSVDPRGFLIAGGRFSLAEWIGLDDDEREAAIEAGEVLEQRRADLIVDTLAERVAEELERLQLERMAKEAGA